MDDQLATTLQGARDDLRAAVDALEQCQRDHRQVESVLLGVLEHVPVPLAVVDADLRVRAQSKAGQQAWGDRLGRSLVAVPAPLVRAIPACERILGGETDRAEVEGLMLAAVEEPGTCARYVVTWQADESPAS